MCGANGQKDKITNKFVFWYSRDVGSLLLRGGGAGKPCPSLKDASQYESRMLQQDVAHLPEKIVTHNENGRLARWSRPWSSPCAPPHSLPAHITRQIKKNESK